VADDLVLVGRIAKPHGLRGDVAINPDTDFAEDRFAVGARLLLTRRELGTPVEARIEEMTVAAVRFHNGRPIVRFRGLESIDAVEPLAGASLWIRAASRPPLPEGTYYHDALIGCDVETVAGERVGQVIRIDAFGSAPILVVHDGRSDVLIPLAETICIRIDPAARRIVIDPPEGLLDVNR
jgi:16S rRNA processing protein RimM